MSVRTQNSIYSYDSHEVGLTELLRALELLKPESNEIRIQIADALGLSWRRSKEDKIIGPKTPLKQPDSVEKIGEEFTPELEIPIKSPELKLLTDSPGEFLEPEIHEVQIPEILFDNSDPILASAQALETTDIALHMGRPKYQPLLHDRRFRGLMSIMLATSGASKEIDLPTIERKIVKGELLERLPFRQRPTLKQGILLFLDRSESMQPFWRDENELLTRLQRFLGHHKVKVFWLEVDSWLPDGPQFRWYSPTPYKFPEKTPVLLVSDFSICGKMSGNQPILKPWLQLLYLARRDNCPIVALIPAPESYWSNELRQLIDCPLVWDHDTSISSLRRYHQRTH